MTTRDAYAAWAGTYDSDVNPTRDLDAACLRAARLDLAGKSVVELGAGTGKNTGFLAARAAHVTAFDLTPAMLAKARARIPAVHVDFIEHDITCPWPLATATQDAVIANLVLEHIARLEPVFAEASRVLRPGGQLYLAELHPLRQLRGSQARFELDGTTRTIEAHLHTIPDYLQCALSHDFTLEELDEPIEAGRTVGHATPPRLLTLLFSRNG